MELTGLEGLNRDEPVYMIGIGGAGMSAIATVLLQMGFKVEGSDIKESSYVRRLREAGASVGIGHRADNLRTPSVVVRSSAIAADNPEILEAQRKDIPVVSRAAMLAYIMETKKGIAVAGTHGKTTTSSMIANMLMACGEDPAYLIGGELNEIGGNAHYGEGEYLVAEADESDGSLLVLEPRVIVLTNVDWDHLDYYRSIEETVEVFRRFLSDLTPQGFAVICGDDPRARALGTEFVGAGGSASFYGSGPDNDYRFEGIAMDVTGCSYRASADGRDLGMVSTGVPGIHNVYNSLAALAVGHRIGLDTGHAIEGIRAFKGVRRRYEKIGQSGGMTVIDDYAHHPTEIRAVLRMARELDPGRIVVVFQPHRYSRTKMLAAEFGESFGPADLLVVTDVYGAGEEPEPGVTGELIADAVMAAEPGKQVIYLPERSRLARGVVDLLERGDTVITMGAGDVTYCAREILEVLGPP